MKINLKNIMIILGILITSSSCDNFLDVHPKGEVLNKDLLKDQQGFENALYGVYATMRDSNLYGRYFSYYTLDIMAQYYTSFGNTYVSELRAFNYKHTEVEKGFYQIWCKMYNNISNVNNILGNLQHESPTSLQYYNIYKGEALGLRAFMHFDLLRLFSEQITLNQEADGIPYATEFSLTAPKILKAKEVYSRIKTDLRTAEQLLNDAELYNAATSYDKFLKDQSIHFNLQAIQATLARVYLTQNNADSALYYAEKVIKSEKQSLLKKTEINGDLAGILSKKETIFGLYGKGFYENISNDLQKAISFYSLDPRRNIDALYALNRVGNDYRWDSWFSKLNQVLRMIKITDKYQLINKECPTDIIQGINLIRLPEMFYIAAEVLLQKGKYPEALNYFNQVLISRGLVALDERTPQETLTVERIDDERYKEFIGEGQAFFNMKRRNLNFQNADGQAVSASSQIYTVQVPEQEFDYRK
ncbi:MAG: RagB/SusD family nutrient uptake outer membrane protein [Odoribacter sp.]